MDPFTEKLLARTQARKAAIAKKREEVAGRSPVVTPRRPLAENNTSTDPSTPIKNIQNADQQNTPVRAAKGTPVVVTSTQFAGGTRKSVFFEKYAKQASLKQKECFIELGEAKGLTKSTPEKKTCGDERKSGSSYPKPKENLMTAAVQANMESPSVKDRKAMYMKQVQEVSTPSKSCLMSTFRQDKECENDMDKTTECNQMFPSIKEARVSLAGGRFFNDPRSPIAKQPALSTTNKTAPEKPDTPMSTKPPRVTITVASKVLKQDQLQGDEDDDKPPAKPPRLASQTGISAPPKPPRLQSPDPTSGDIKATGQSSNVCHLKRPAPSPPCPTKNIQDQDVRKPAETEQVPKRCKNEIKGGALKDSDPGKKTSPSSKNVHSHDSVSKSGGSFNSSPVATKRCKDELKNDIPTKKQAIKRNAVVKSVTEKAAGADFKSPVKGLMVPDAASPMANIVKESTPTQDNEKGDIKRTLKPQKISAISLGEIETNPHEITFNISMTEFDQALEVERESIFQMTYNESIQKAASQQRESKFSDSDDHLYDTAAPVQATFKGVHKSGYNSASSDQYATIVTPKKPKRVTQRNYTVHEKIQMLLEEAAYQQNIVLQASQAVNTCLALHEGVSTGSSEEVEAERLLKFSTERRTACLEEVQKLKAAEENEGDTYMNEDPEGELPCKATLTVSGLKVSVDQKMLANQNSSEPCIYNFICIIKHKPKQMYCTKAVNSEEIRNDYISFDDKFEIKNVDPSFTLDINLFVLKKPLPLVNLANRHKRRATTKSVLDSPKIKQIMGSAKKATEGTSQAVTPGSAQGPVFRTSGFVLVSTTCINLQNVHQQKQKMNLVTDYSVLTGDLHMKVICNPEYCNQAKGFLTVFEDVGGLGDWIRYWCILHGNVLQYWKYPDEDLIKPPLGSIDLAYCVSDSVTVVRRDICARPHTMQLVLEKPVTSLDRETLIAVNSGGKMVIKYMLSADTKADKVTWMNTLNDSLKDWRAWHPHPSDRTRWQSQTDSDVVML